ncbi:hypothetical protein JHW43_004720 [Diplocarpon mali]|nr:hypothetical protein JHW43_004720 [Diplocarpon mali]
MDIARALEIIDRLDHIRARQGFDREEMVSRSGARKPASYPVLTAGGIQSDGFHGAPDIAGYFVPKSGEEERRQRNIPNAVDWLEMRNEMAYCVSERERGSKQFQSNPGKDKIDTRDPKLRRGDRAFVESLSTRRIVFLGGGSQPCLNRYFEFERKHPRLAVAAIPPLVSDHLDSTSLLLHSRFELVNGQGEPEHFHGLPSNSVLVLTEDQGSPLPQNYLGYVSCLIKVEAEEAWMLACQSISHI